MNKVGIERIIYDNYDLYETYEGQAKENLESNGVANPSENDIMDEIQFLDELAWDNTKLQLEEFFNNGSMWLITGIVRRWDGPKEGGSTFRTFSEMWYKATFDCDYVRLYDVNGHFYLQCSHHDGTNCFEIKKLTDRGRNHYELWENNCHDSRNLREVHEKLKSRGYSVLPNFVHQVYGCKLREYA